MIKTISYAAINKGCSLGIIGAVHGNEKCGTIAINRVIYEIDSGYIKLNNGSLHLMPIANPKAYIEDVRFIERNLNRYLYEKKENVLYEDYLDTTICKFIKQADFLLDLHSYSSPANMEDEAFIFLSGDNGKEIEYAKNIGVKNFIYGWQQAFQNTGIVEEDEKESQGTTEYARLHGITAVTLECGQHLSTTAPNTAYLAIIKSLIYFNMLDKNCLAYLNHTNNKNNSNELLNKQQNLLCVNMQEVYYKNKGDKLFKEWIHLDKIEKNQVLAYRQDGSELLAKCDGYILLPKINANDGGEWFYFGVLDKNILN